MKKIISLLAVLTFLSYYAGSQDIERHAPAGYDSLRTAISHGKIDSVVYTSKTVGTNRKALIYTPPGYSKNNKYPVFYLLHGIGGDEREWLRGGHPEIIFMLRKRLNR